MKKARGVLTIFDPAQARPQEIDTFTCCHCQQIVEKKPFQASTDEAVGAWCHLCDAPMCLRCIGKGCSPFERRLDQIERRRQNEEAMR